LVADYDIVADGSDNFPTRYLVNDACALAGKPDVHASIFRFEGHLSVFDARSGPCYRCLFREPPPPGEVPSCAEGGVLGVLPGILGTLQALEVIKLVLGHGEPLRGRLLVFDGLAGESHTVRLRKDPACPLCGDAPTIRAPVEPAAYCTTQAPAQARHPSLVTVEALAARRAAGESVALIDVRDAQEFALVHIAGARLLPLAELQQRIGELDPSLHYVVCCHKGPRSLRAAEQLRAAGFGAVSVLEGGVDAWAARIDPGLPRY
jgi:adenylyltransferase/sulfurtransferase